VWSGTRPFAIPFGPGDLGAAEAAGAGDPDAFGAEAERRLHGALHRPAERDTALELVGDALGDELGVDLGLADFDDVERHVARGHRRELLAKLLDVGALLADDHAGARSIDGDAASLAGRSITTLEIAALRDFLHDEVADLQILEQQSAIVAAVGVPRLSQVRLICRRRPIGFDF
jgi:hypothetical protein